MAIDGPPRLDPGLAAEYGDIARERGGPLAVERVALRSRSRAARDLLSYHAAPGGRTADELLAAIRAAETSRAARPAPPLALDWTMSLVRVLAMQQFSVDDLDDAVLLLRELRRQHGRGMLTSAVQHTAVALLWEAGEHGSLRRGLPSLRRLRPEVRRFVRADLTNPFRQPAASRKRRIAYRMWQTLVDQIFAEHGVEPITVADSADTPFDGLTCDVDDPVRDGPLVTVAITVFRPGPELLTSVRSICHQTWRNLEILIVDDASPPGHADVLDACAGLDSRITVHRMNRNGGTYLARNAALDLARGEFFTVQDADDWSHPRRIEMQAKALLADPATPASRSHCLRVSEDLIFQRAGYETSQENASSLMFRREQALATIGYFDSSRKSADTEYRKRLELATGARITDVRAPLAFIRMAAGSLSRADFTPGWHHSSRYIYRGAYERWHARLVGGADPYLPRFQEQRRFAVPQRFQVDQDAITARPEHYDVVMLNDWKYLEGTQRAMLAEIDALTAAGYRVGLSHRESFATMTRRRQPLRPEILDLINAGTVDFVALDQVATVSLLLVRSPEILQFAPVDASTLDVSGVLVVADHAQESGDRYRPATCDATVRSLFGVEPVWAAQSSTVHSFVAADVPAHRLGSSPVPDPTGTDDAAGQDAFLTTIDDLIGPPRPRADTVSSGELGRTGTDAPGTRPAPPAAAAPAFWQRLDLILMIPAARASHLADTLQRIRDDERLFRVPLTVVYGDEAQGDVDEAARHFPSVRFVRADGAAPVDLAGTAGEQLLNSSAEFVSVANLPRTREVRSWSRSIQRELDRLQQVELKPKVPLFVWSSMGSQYAVAHYLRWALTSEAATAGPFADYLGRLALQAASPRLEALDPSDGGVQALVWFAGKFLPGMPQPPWQYRLVLTQRSMSAVSSEPVMLTPRVDSRGHQVWENLTAGLPVQEGGDGNFVVEIELDTQIDHLQTRRRLRPAKGVLLDARTVEMAVPAKPGAILRYLVHTTGTARSVFLTVQGGTGLRAKTRWAATMVRKDLGSLVRRRGSRRMIALRLVRLFTRPFFAGRQIWLIGERTDTAQDNGLHLFRHLRLANPRRRVYYVIDRSSPQRDRVAHLGNVVDHSSVRHQLLMLHARVLANAYSIRYLTPTSWRQENYVRHLAWRIGALRVYLKHGVHLNANAVKRGLSGYDMFLTVMSRESEALRAVSGYDREIREIGMPRYDGLTPAPRSRTILFMPTWRQYLVPRLSGKANPGQIPFEGSAYEQFVAEFLNSPRLLEMLARRDYRLTFLPHYNMASAFGAAIAATDRVTVADTNVTSFQDLLRTCDAFITDYSSVHFDVAYLGTPVIYAQFDEEEYAAGHASPSWFDYERDGYGPVTRSVSETLTALERVLERDCVVESVYAARVSGSFTYRDQNNSARVVEAIDELSTGSSRQVDQARAPRVRSGV